MKVCSNCNQTNPPEALFCRQCASPLTGGQAQQGQQYARPQAQYGNQPNFGNQPVQTLGLPAQGASGRAMAAAGLAVAGLLCCFVAGIPAAILGWLEMTAIKEGKSSPAGMMMAQVGLWLGIAGLVINAIVSFILFILMALGNR